MIEPIRQRKPGDCTGVAGGNCLTHHQIDLCHPHREGGGQGDAHQLLHLGGEAGQSGAQGDARTCGGAPDQHQLRNACKGDHPDQPVDHLLSEQSARDHCGAGEDVQQHRRRRRRRKAPGGIQNAGKQCGQRHAKDVGKDNAAIADGQIKPRIPVKATGGQQHQRWHEHHAQCRQQQNRSGKKVERILSKALRVLTRLPAFGKHRHEGRVERALSKETAEHIGQAEGGVKRIPQNTGADIGGDEDFTHEAQNPARQRPESDCHKAGHQFDRLHVSARFAPSMMASRSFFSSDCCLAAEWYFKPNMSFT